MSIFVTINAISGFYLFFGELNWINPFSRSISFLIDIFYPPGEPISRHRLRCSLFDVEYYAFTDRFLHLNEWVGWVGLGS